MPQQGVNALDVKSTIDFMIIFLIVFNELVNRVGGHITKRDQIAGTQEPWKNGVKCFAEFIGVANIPERGISEYVKLTRGFLDAALIEPFLTGSEHPQKTLPGGFGFNEDRALKHAFE